MKKLMLALAVFAACNKDDSKKTETPAATPPATAPAPATAPTTPPPAPAAKPAELAPPAAAAAGTPRPASITEADQATADQLISTLKDFGDALEKAGTDCKAATAAAKSFGDKFKPIAEAAEKIKARTESDPAAKAWFQSNYMPKMMGLMQPMMKSAQACATDKDFQAAMNSMPMPGKKVKAAAPTKP
jgi:hypothetical protein